MGGSERHADMNRRIKRILLIEDDRTLSRLVGEQLGAMGYSVTNAYNWAEGKAALVKQDPSLAILDMRLPDAEGLACLSELSAQCPVIVLTAYSSIRQAVAAMRAGASEYLAKPVNPAELELAVTRALEADSLRRSYEYVRSQLTPSVSKLMVGSSRAFKELVRLIELIAPSEATVLIEGESGVGKELVAQSIHQLSRRASRNFVPVDCCTLQESLFESELFGHERGAFTGADSRKQGLIEVAERGTLFLDEIGELPATMQAKLLRLLETGEFRRLGGTQGLASDCRFVAATNRDLAAFSQAGGFRRDLYYRLAAVVVRVPSLRERREDIPLIAEHFLRSRSFKRQVEKQLSEAAVAAISAYDWPGNIRELRNVIERALLVSGDAPCIDVEHLGFGPTSPSGEKTVADEFALSFAHQPTLEEIKRNYLARLLREFGGHRARIASVLGISERNTYRLIKKYRLDG